MLTRDDLTHRDRLEQVRDTIAATAPGTWALAREEALVVLGAVVDQLRTERHTPDR